MTDLQLSKHFKLSEFTKSKMAKQHDIANNPDTIHVNNLIDLCKNTLEVIRDYYGKPIDISSGYRCLELNALVKGARNSQHVKGEAVDFTIRGLTDETVFKAVLELKNQGKIDFDQIILEPSWIHISYRYGNNRNEALTKDNNGYHNYEY